MSSSPSKPPTRTLDVIASLADNPAALVQAGELVDLRFPVGSHLSLRGAKLFCLLVQAAGVRIVAPEEHRLTLASLNTTFHVSVPELVELVDELHGTIIKLQLKDAQGRRFTKTGPILADVEREDEDQAQAELRFTFGPALRKAISNSTHWAVLSRRAVLTFTSRYALRLYTIMSLRTGLRRVSQEFTLDDLRELLGVPPGKLTRWQSIKQKVLEPALAEVNHLSGFQVAYRPLKRGRAVVGVSLAWAVKDEPGRVEALKELERPKVGRRARREDGTDRIVTKDDQEREALVQALDALPPPPRLI